TELTALPGPAGCGRGRMLMDLRSGMSGPLGQPGAWPLTGPKQLLPPRRLRGIVETRYSPGPGRSAPRAILGSPPGRPGRGRWYQFLQSGRNDARRLLVAGI